MVLPIVWRVWRTAQEFPERGMPIPKLTERAYRMQELNEAKGEAATDELGAEVFASTIQASLGGGGPGDNVDEDDLDEAAIERSIREINEAIRRSANGTRKA